MSLLFEIVLGVGIAAIVMLLWLIIPALRRGRGARITFEFGRHAFQLDRELDLTQLLRTMSPLLGVRRKSGLPGALASFVQDPHAARILHTMPPQAAAPQAARIELPPSIPLDAVHFSVTAPLSVAPAATFELNFWAHPEAQRAEVLARAKQILATPNVLFKSEGPFQLERGARLTVRLSVPDCEVEPAHKPLLWLGEIANASFLITVPAGTPSGTRKAKASVRLNGQQIATLHFLLAVGTAGQSQPLEPGAVPIVETTTHKSAFASYASEDRDQVISRIQGMETAVKDLRVFVDVVDLRSGQYWEQELKAAIRDADVFYLFWCRHAKISEWVEMEWRYAFDLKGRDFIDPVPLEPAEFAEPPSELGKKHFNDPLLAFLKDTGHAAAPPS